VCDADGADIVELLAQGPSLWSLMIEGVRWMLEICELEGPSQMKGISVVDAGAVVGIAGVEKAVVVVAEVEMLKVLKAAAEREDDVLKADAGMLELDVGVEGDSGMVLNVDAGN